MMLPVDAKNFDPITGAITLVAQINLPLSQLSAYITALQTEGTDIALVTMAVTTGEALTERDAAYVNPVDNEMYAIDADAAPALAGTIRGFVQATVSSGVIGSLVIGGILSGFSGLTAWLPVYADSTGAGTITQTRPYPLLDSGQMAIVPLGMAISATHVLVMPEFMDNRIRYQKRFSPALDETTTVEHGQNQLGLGRKVGAYVTQSSTAVEYASSNQDSSAILRGSSGAGGVTTVDTAGATLADIGDNANTDQRIAQSFQVTAGQLSQFTVSFGANNGSPTGTVTWSICADNSGIPGTVLQSGTFTPTASSNNTVNIADGVFLDASTTYWLMLQATTLQGTNNRWQANYSGANPYANGLLKADSGVGSYPNTWAILGGSRDLRCTITTAALTTKDKLAQGIQISSASTISTVRLWLKKVGSPTGNLTIKLQTDSSGSPSGTTVTNGTSATVAASSLSTSYGYIDFAFSTPPSLSATTQYHIVLETADSASNTNYVEWGADGSSPGYASGVMKYEFSSTWSAESKDAVFQVIAGDVGYINPVRVDWWTSTNADMVNQFGDTSGADVDIKTTFKCKAASGFADVTVEVIL
jgi:hypothetical protein